MYFCNRSTNHNAKFTSKGKFVGEKVWAALNFLHIMAVAVEVKKIFARCAKNGISIFQIQRLTAMQCMKNQPPSEPIK